VRWTDNVTLRERRHRASGLFLVNIDTQGPGRSDMRAKSCTFVVCVAEKSMVWRFSG